MMDVYLDIKQRRPVAVPASHDFHVLLLCLVTVHALYEEETRGMLKHKSYLFFTIAREKFT